MNRWKWIVAALLVLLPAAAWAEESKYRITSYNVCYTKLLRDSTARQYEQAVASQRLSRKHLTDATLYAPTSGYIAKRSIEPGDTTAPGQPRNNFV